MVMEVGESVNGKKNELAEDCEAWKRFGGNLFEGQNENSSTFDIWCWTVQYSVVVMGAKRIEEKVQRVYTCNAWQNPDLFELVQIQLNPLEVQISQAEKNQA